ncbi:SsrA-binding protein [Autumnicola musiva]|uniref:SsrA-binding protein n=1 Tax=Autumnicola musiva TaxID=3075589 RepID=A0ABU3D9A4_9FLAO|nr:SsrA-binding protein [Zunongwangia sp. F117]MDT0678116.1 SsrA-binding protein [Zunongwangia sp. F117]
MKKKIFQILAGLNKKIFPSYSKNQLDLQKASKIQKVIIGWKLWVTKNSLD